MKLIDFTKKYLNEEEQQHDSSHRRKDMKEMLVIFFVCLQVLGQTKAFARLGPELEVQWLQQFLELRNYCRVTIPERNKLPILK